jgi:hypothetical protein
VSEPNSPARGAEPTLEPALLTRTSRELLGERPLPTLLQRRPVAFLLGPAGVGKRTVAARLLPPEALRLDADRLRRELNAAGRNRRWSSELLAAPGLLLDGLDCLHRRYGAVRLLGELVQARASEGRRTALTQGPADASVTALYPELAHDARATVLLRFPVGGGRRRFVKERCAARGLDPARAGDALGLEPWTYAAVEVFLDNLR